MITAKKLVLLPIVCALAAASITPALALNPQPLPPRVHPHLGHPPGNPGITPFCRKAGGDKWDVAERTFRPG
jgi:hypothetical protein